MSDRYLSYDAHGKGEVFLLYLLLQLCWNELTYLYHWRWGWINIPSSLILIDLLTASFL